MTVEQLSSNELTLLSSLIKQSKEKLNKIIFQTGKVNDVRSERLIKIVELAISLK
jgi:succinate dehydrogenase flavin-adding protein (antitoxin of CptAB toxin-antitoxin module)